MFSEERKRKSNIALHYIRASIRISKRNKICIQWGHLANY